MSNRNNYPRNIIRAKTVRADKCKYREKSVEGFICNSTKVSDTFSFERSGTKYCGRENNQYCRRRESRGFMERVTKNMEEVLGDEESLLLSFR